MVTKSLQNQVLEIARRVGIRIIGPNCLGIIRTPSKLNASFAPSMPKEGNVAFISQSGALVDSILDWAIERGYGFSTVVSYGNKAAMAQIGTSDLTPVSTSIVHPTHASGEHIINWSKTLRKIMPKDLY